MADLTKIQKEQIEADKQEAIKAAVAEALAAKEAEVVVSKEAKVDKAKKLEAYLNEKVSYALPLIDPKDPQLFVAVNGKKWIIKRGKNVRIPRYLKKHLDEVEAQRVSIMEMKARLQQKSAE